MAKNNVQSVSYLLSMQVITPQVIPKPQNQSWHKFTWKSYTNIKHKIKKKLVPLVSLLLKKHTRLGHAGIVDHSVNFIVMREDLLEATFQRREHLYFNKPPQGFLTWNKKTKIKTQNHMTGKLHCTQNGVPKAWLFHQKDFFTPVQTPTRPLTVTLFVHAINLVSLRNNCLCYTQKVTLLPIFQNIIIKSWREVQIRRPHSFYIASILRCAGLKLTYRTCINQVSIWCHFVYLMHGLISLFCIFSPPTQ